MRVTSRGEYGVRALVDLALHVGQGPIPLKAIAERQGISEHYLEQLMAAMRKSGLVRSVRGALGGYELADDPKSITIGRIITTLEGPLLDPGDGDDARGDEFTKQAIGEMWTRLASEIEKLLDGITLADLVEEVERLRASGGALMWHI